MSTVIDKEWAAIRDDEIVETAETKDDLKRKLRDRGWDPDAFEICALPKAHKSLYI